MSLYGKTTLKIAFSNESTTASDTGVPPPMSASPLGALIFAGSPPGAVPIGRSGTPATVATVPLGVTRLITELLRSDT